MIPLRDSPQHQETPVIAFQRTFQHPVFAHARLKKLRQWTVGLSLAVLGTAWADIHVGVVLSLTGPGASLGIPEEKVIQLWPAELGGQKVKFSILNDNTDTSTASKNTMRLIAEDKVDLIIGSSVTPTSLAVVEAAGAEKVPVISLAGGGAIVLPQEGPRRWAFKLSPTEAISTQRVLDHMGRAGLKSMATIGVANSYGDGFLKTVEALAPSKGIKLVASEKYNATDQSVTAQVLKVLSANPEAVYILSAGTPGALPHIELVQRGYKGHIYQTQGVANADFLRVGGKALDGSFITAAPVLVGDQLPDSNPIKKVAVEFLKKSDAALGAHNRSLFGATAWDALLIADMATRTALKSAKPGTPEFRSAVRDAIEGLKGFVGTEGVYTMSAQDHNGVDERSQVMIKIDNGKWVYQP
jgi:branched-chain amino acid transport system substrate-binding protein